MSDTVRKLKDKASRLYSHGRLKDALAAYSQVLQEDPSELQCQVKVGDLHRRLGNKDAAIQAYLPVARSYAADGLLLKAVAVCKMVLALNDEHAETVGLINELHAKRRGPAEAGPPVTLQGMGISPPPGGMVVAPPGANFGLDKLVDDGSPSGLELDADAPATGSLPYGATNDMWATEEDAWTADIPAEDDDVDITVGARVPTGAAVPAVDPELAPELTPKIVVGTPVQSGPASAADNRPTVAWPAGATPQGVAWPVATGDTQELPFDAIGEELANVQIPLFSDLPRNAFIDLLVKMGLHEVEPGDVVIREGDVGDAFYVVATGKVRVSIRGTEGNEIPLAYLSDGAFFGEMAVLQNGVRTASVIAEQSSQIFEIKREVLDEVIEAYPSVAKVLRNFYRQRLLSTTMSTHPVFTPFNAEERRSLMEMFKSRHVKAGEILLEQGKKGTGLFILLHGQLEVVRVNPEGQTITLAHLVAGDMVGEMSLLTNGPTAARVLAATDCFVLRLSKRKFDEVIMTHPQVLELVSEVSSARASINDALLGSQQSLTGGTVLV